MNNSYESAVLAALKCIKAKGDTEGVHGICYLLYRCPTIHERILKVNTRYFRSWPEFSGIVGYPVPHKALLAEDAYYTLPKWDKDTTYGQARWRLLEHLIKCYEKELGL